LKPGEGLLFIHPALGRLPYRWISHGRDAENKPLPLVLFLHGAGERGSDNHRQLSHFIPELLEKAEGQGLAFHLLAPQCPENAQWVETDWSAPGHKMPNQPSRALALVMAILETWRQRPDVDPARVVLAGISMGGYGVWDLAARRREWFSAAIPICGGGDPSHAETLSALPLWAFHGDRDEEVPVHRTLEMIQAIRARGGDPRMTIFPGGGHDAWTPALRTPGLIPWMFEPTKG